MARRSPRTDCERWSHGSSRLAPNSGLLGDGEPGDGGQEADERDDAGSGAHRQRDPSLVGCQCDAKRVRLRLVSAPARDGAAWGRTPADAMAGHRSEVALLDDSWRIREECPRAPGLFERDGSEDCG